MGSTLRVGIAQAASVHLDLNKSIEKLESIIADAASKGVQILACGETWLSGYPSWLDYGNNVAKWDDPGMKEAFNQLSASAVMLDGPEMNSFQKLAKSYEMAIVLGINERDSSDTGTIYNSFVIINEHGEIAVHHRKLMPTFSEKLVYGLGYGEGLEAAPVHDTKLGALICWEHWMPLARQAVYNSGEYIHVALWPMVHDRHILASRHYAFEGKCYVLAVGQLFHADQTPDGIELPAEQQGKQLLDGGSCIIGPDGNFVTEPVYGSEELIVQELDLSTLASERMYLDVAGHYSRPDVFDFSIRK